MSLLWFHRDDRIEQDGEVGASIVFCQSADGRSQMTSSREAHNTHILTVDVPDRGAVAHGAHRLAGIFHGHSMSAMRHTVFQHKKSYALLVEILSPVVSLMIEGQMRIASTRTVDDSSSRRVLGQIAGQITLTVSREVEYELFSCRLR